MINTSQKNQEIYRKCIFLLFITLSFILPYKTAFTDQVYIRVLADICFSCHKPGKNHFTEIPRIDHMNARQIERQIKAFRDGERTSTIMQRIAQGFSDIEIKLISSYIARNVK